MSISLEQRRSETCRNRVRAAVYNYDGAVGSITNFGRTDISTNYDYWDTIDDQNAGSGFPTGIVTGWGNNTDCGGVETVADDANVWKDVTTAGTGAATCVGSPEKCTMKDKITGLWWSKLQSGAAKTWSAAINLCDVLTFNGQTDWRLPTQREMMEATNHSMKSAASANWTADSEMPNYFWSGSSAANLTNYAWSVSLADGGTYRQFKTENYRVVCVR